MPDVQNGTMNNGTIGYQIWSWPRSVLNGIYGDSVEPTTTAGSIAQHVNRPYDDNFAPAPASPTTVAAGPVADPESKAITPKVAHDITVLHEHARLCKKLNIYSPAGQELSTVNFETLLSEMGVRVYDPAQVKAYLDVQYGPPADNHGIDVSTATWGYRPLQYMESHPGSFRYITRNGYVGASGELSPYTKPVPMPVLLTVERIVDKFPDAKFFVTDNLTEKEVSDPFLLVRYHGKDYIIERWDEPNYTER